MNKKVAIYLICLSFLSPVFTFAESSKFDLLQLPNLTEAFNLLSDYSTLSKGELLTNDLSTTTRKGTVVIVPQIQENQTQLTISIFADPEIIDEKRAISVRVQQVPFFGETWEFGGMEIPDVREALINLRKNGKKNSALSLTLGEQILREDVVSSKWKTRREITTINDSYYQMAMDKLRIYIRTYDPKTGEDADLSYSVSISTKDKLPVGLPSGHHSASLIGTFAAAEASATTVNSGSRTTTAGSLIVGFGGSWESGANQDNSITDGLTGCANPCNTYIEPIDLQFGPNTRARITIAYNMAGTRGTSHVIKNTKTQASLSTTVGGGEFSGINPSLTVVSNTATGNSAAPSVGVTAGSSSLFVGITGYDAASPTTITENTAGGWALVIEADENNDAQDFNTQYKGGITGLQTATWSLGASVDWGAGIVAFTEATSSSILNVKVRGQIKIRGKVKFR